MYIWFLAACTADTDKAGADSAPPDVDSGDSGVLCEATAPTIALPDFLAADAYETTTVEPSTIDPATNLGPGVEHQVFLPGAPGRPELFVWLTGTDGKPSNNLHILDIAARSGYRTIGLAYPTDENTGDVCPGSDDYEVCTDAFNREKLYGADELDGIEIDEPNSVVGRLTRLVVALETYAPAAGFGAYLDDGAIRWDSVVVAGWSQGSTLTASLGKDHALFGSVHLAAGCNPIEGDGELVPSAWCLEPRATSLERMYSLIHTLDDWAFDSQISWETYDLDSYGASADAGTLSPDYCTAPHLLTTALPDQEGGAEYHKSLATDATIPLDADGVPVLAEDYYWLFTLGEG